VTEVLTGLVFVAVGVALALLPDPSRAWLGAVSSCLGVAMVLLFTLVRPQNYAMVGWWPWDVWRVASVGRLWPDGTWEQQNLLLMMPFVWSVTLALRRPALAACAAVLLSCAVEYAQGARGIGTTQLADLVHNSLGAMLGAGAAYLLLRAGDRARAGRRSSAGPGSAAGTHESA
jgi:hypothetical protein